MPALYRRRAFLQHVGALSVTPIVLTSCKRDGAGSGPPKVAVSVFPLWDVARRIAGDKLDVALVLPAGKTEHAFDPTPKDVARISGARLAVSVGLGMDGWLAKVVQGAAAKDLVTLEVGPKAKPLAVGKEAVGEDDDHDHDHDGHDDHAAHEHHEGALDPHVWLDPQRMAMIVDPITDAFVKLLPAAEKELRDRATETRKAIDALDQRIASRAKAWTKRTIVTFHGSFGYFASRYGLTIAAVIEPFPGKEPTAKYLKTVLDAIAVAKPAALFSEPQLDRKPAQVVADQAKLPLLELDPIGGLAPADTYERLIESNVDVLDKVLK